MNRVENGKIASPQMNTDEPYFLSSNAESGKADRKQYTSQEAHNPGMYKKCGS